MEIYRATTIEEDGTLAIKGLLFAAGDKVEVIIRNQPAESGPQEKYPFAIASARLPGEFHNDTADQIIVATARAHDCPLLTRDSKILSYPHVNSIA